MPNTDPTSLLHTQDLAFIGGGNMASALIQGVLQSGTPSERIHVQEPHEAARASLKKRFGVHVWAQSGSFLHQCDTIVWAIKPQVFKQAAQEVLPFCQNPLHLSVAAGIVSSSIAHWLQSQRVVRSMPNTPALIGKGQTGLFAQSGVSEDDRLRVQSIMASTGEYLWVQDEAHLNAVTALSGSGPAYVFYFIEALCRAGQSMGLTPNQAKQLAIGTFEGASALCKQAEEPVNVLRERVTSKGGTTQAALETLERLQVGDHIEQAVFAACHRAQTLGEEFGA
jgi:pyrroline-5-carboxylate reductase